MPLAREITRLPFTGDSAAMRSSRDRVRSFASDVSTAHVSYMAAIAAAPAADVVAAASAAPAPALRLLPVRASPLVLPVTEARGGARVLAPCCCSPAAVVVVVDVVTEPASPEAAVAAGAPASLLAVVPAAPGAETFDAASSSVPPATDDASRAGVTAPLQASDETSPVAGGAASRRLDWRARPGATAMPPLAALPSVPPAAAGGTGGAIVAGSYARTTT